MQQGEPCSNCGYVNEADARRCSRCKHMLFGSTGSRVDIPKNAIASPETGGAGQTTENLVRPGFSVSKFMGNKESKRNNRCSGTPYCTGSAHSNHLPIPNANTKANPNAIDIAAWIGCHQGT